MRWHELTPVEQLRRKADWEQLASLPGVDSSGFERRATDAGIALFEAATDESRHRDVARQIETVRAALDRTGRWEDESEWRISTYGTEWIERIDSGFRAGADFNGRFRGDFETFGEAWEAVRVLADLGMSLFYALNWTTRESTPDLEPEADRPIAEAYLKRLARESGARPPAVDELRSGDWLAEGERVLSVVSAPTPADWDDPPERIYIVKVQSDSLEFECHCTTPERARLFLGVFDTLVSDLLEILKWEPLPAEAG